MQSEVPLLPLRFQKQQRQILPWVPFAAWFTQRNIFAAVWCSANEFKTRWVNSSWAVVRAQPRAVPGYRLAWRRGGKRDSTLQMGILDGKLSEGLVSIHAASAPAHSDCSAQWCFQCSSPSAQEHPWWKVPRCSGNRVSVKPGDKTVKYIPLTSTHIFQCLLESCFCWGGGKQQRDQDVRKCFCWLGVKKIFFLSKMSEAAE